MDEQIFEGIEKLKINNYLINKTIVINGSLNKEIIAMEECGELIQAISKDIRYNTYSDNSVDQASTESNLIEEIADVLLVIQTLICIAHIDPKDIQKWIDMKQTRQVERDNNVEDNGDKIGDVLVSIGKAIDKSYK